MHRHHKRTGGMSLNSVDALLEEAGLTLEEDERGLALSDGLMSVRADFSKMSSRLVPDRLNRELLVRAAKTKRPKHSLRKYTALSVLFNKKMCGFPIID